MSLSRRRLFQRVGAAGRAAFDPGASIAARGREAAAAEGLLEEASQSPDTTLIRIMSNENPMGPGQHVIDTIVGRFPEAGRYPFNAHQKEPALVKAIAEKQGVGPDQVVLGCGSGEILTNAVRAFTSASKPLATAWPTFENPHDTAKKIGTPLRMVDLDADLRLDVDKMVQAATGAGLVFFCNPNNPTATVHGADVVTDFVSRVRKASPDTVILIDEAYHDYVTDPSYKTAIPLAKTTPNVFVARTFSKAYGMAGMRVGYAVGHADTLKVLGRFRMPYGVSLPAIAAAINALGHQAHIDAEQARNTEVRRFTIDAFKDMGYESSDSQANFIFVNLRRPAGPFRDACRKAGVAVGRDFPPYEKTHCRISIGTKAEMEKAVGVFRKVLGATTTVAQNGR